MKFYVSRFFIIGFVLASMLTAVVYHRIFESDLITTESASQIQSWKPDETNKALLQIDHPDQCAVNDNDVSDWPPVYRLERGKKSAEISALCFVPLLRQKMQQSSRTCLHREYLNVAHNAFGDLSSCLDIPQKEFFAILSTERKPGMLGPKIWDHFIQSISRQQEHSCHYLKSVLPLMRQDPFFQNAAELAWHFHLTLESARKLAAQTALQREIPLNWELWFLLRALDVSSVQAVSEVRSSFHREDQNSRVPASIPELMQRWSESEYFQALTKSRDEINKIFQEGTCIPESFLQL